MICEFSIRHFDSGGRHERGMHIASKVILLIGVIMFIGSIVSMGLGVGNIIDLGEENIYLNEQSSGTFTIDENESWDIIVYIIHPVDCDSVDLQIVDSLGNDVAEIYDCDWDTHSANDEEGYVDGSRELYATINHDTSGMEYTLSSNVEVEIAGSYCDEACEEEALSSGLAIVSGFGGICCSVLILIVGIIMAFTLNDPKVNMTTQVGLIPGGQVAYQAPITGQAPVAQTIHQAPVQANQPNTIPITPITPPLTQQPVQEAWWSEKPPQ